MSNYAFDCSQFVAVGTSDQISFMENSRIAGINLVRLMEDSKLGYLEKLVGIPKSFQIWEIVDDEFQGEFEEWKDMNVAPPKLEALIDLIKRVTEPNEELACVIVQSATLNEARIWRCHCLESEFRSKLFAKSIFSVGESSSAEVSVFWVNK